MTSILEHFITLPGGECEVSGEALCRQCAQKGKSCCRTEPELAYLSFPLSLPEWKRLVPYSHLATSVPMDDKTSFAREEASLITEALPAPEADTPAPGGDIVCSEEANRPDFIISMQTLFASEKGRVKSLFPENGFHRTLRTRTDGSCVFLGSQGCRLPRSARPWYCLLFPVWVIRKTLTLFTSADCLIAGAARSPAHGILLLQTTVAAVHAQHASLRKDWGFD